MKKLLVSAPSLLAIGFISFFLAGLTQVSAQSAASDPAEAQPASSDTEEAIKPATATGVTMTADADEPAGQPLTVSEQILQTLSEQLPGIMFTEVTESAIAGLFEVVADGQIYYVDETAQYLIDGNLIRLSDRVNLTDGRLGGIHMGLIEQMDEQDMLIYEPEESADRAITVFTDISCGYCRRLHAEIDTLLEEGVRVRYLLFPRAGLDSQGRKDLESVWCADNPQEAMTIAKSGGEIVPKTCDSPIEKHVALAERLGLRGTPLIYTDSGEKIPGYREAGDLVSMIKSTEPM